jgi:ribosome-associated protein
MNKIGGYMDSRELAKIAIAALEEKKGEDIRIIDISEVSVIADYFIIASGSNINQVQALADNVQEKLYKAGAKERQIEGYNTGSWILLDFNDVIIHVFSQEDRLFYDLERIWRDGKTISVKEFNS